jgi:uroporphyrinogen-III synthase
MDSENGPAVVLTRQHEDNQELTAALAARGVVVREIPCLATRYIYPQQPISKNYDAVVFTSRHGVRGFFQQKLDKTCFHSLQPVLVAAVGKATAEEVQSHDLQVDLVANPPEGAVLADQLKKALPVGSHLLMVRGNLRAGEIDSILNQAGYELEDLVVYENEAVPVPTLHPFPVAAVFIASPSAATRLLKANPWIKAKRFFSIGNTTARALKELGIKQVEGIGADPRQWIEVLFRAYQDAVNLTE